MSAYIYPIKMALVIFPFLALLLSFPLFIKEYRKYGSFPVIKGVLIYSFIFYLLTAFFLTMLPLPSKEVVAQMTSPRIQLIPFANVQAFLRDTFLNWREPSTYLPAMKQSVFLEPLFNIFLTIPFGIYLRYYFRCSLKKTVLLSFCLSLFFEVTQFTGLYFIYPRPYRLADVNDLINNTLGGLIGFALAPLLAKILPTRQEIDELSYHKGQTVSFLRRVVAFLLDWGVIWGFRIVFNPLYTKASPYMWLVEILVYFCLIPAINNGQTFGKAIVRIRVVTLADERVGFFRMTARYLLLYGVTNGLLALAGYFNEAFTTANTPNANAESILPLLIYSVLFSGLVLVQGAILLIGLLMKRLLYYESISKTKEISTIIKK
ncbi:VanZ family protein [Enterococcus nangangensis]|uniref:VanZ family protein n=1 Tax=Enterococcus nangangensis TaxID=2559926 RepID=UPI0010F674EC|nr:VanZ family protein [Enterococcus nangangensis]